MNTPVNFELAKLLAEKGFDNHCDKKYIAQCLWQKPNSREKYRNSEIHQNSSDVSAPTIAEVVMWLYEKHGIWIEVRKVNYSSFEYKIINGTESLMYVKTPYKSLLSPTEAYEAAIEYTLENIK